MHTKSLVRATQHHFRDMALTAAERKIAVKRGLLKPLATYKPPKSAPGLNSLADTVPYGASPSTPSYDPGNTQPVAAASPLGLAPPVAAPTPAPAAARDPRDSDYYNAIARAAATRDQNVNALTIAQAGDDTDYTEAMRRLGLQQPVDEQTAKVNANNQGLLLSSALGLNLGNIDTNYTRQESDAQLTHDRTAASRKSQIAGYQSGYTLDEQDAMAAAIARQVANDSNLAGQGALPAAAPAPAASTPTAAQVAKWVAAGTAPAKAPMVVARAPQAQTGMAVKKTKKKG